MPITGSESPDNNAMRQLRDSVSDLNKSTKLNNKIMIFLTIILVFFTILLTIPVITDYLV